MSAWRALPAAFLAGASALGTQVLLLGGVGLALGHGRGEALGLALSVAGWGLGAFLLGRSALGRRAAPALGLLAGLVLWGGPRVVLLAAKLDPAGALALTLSLIVLVCAAGFSGALLALVVRVGLGGDRRAGLAGIWALDLAGAVLGAALAFRLQAELGRHGAGLVLGSLAAAAGFALLLAPRRELVLALSATKLPELPRDGSQASLPWSVCALVVGLTSGSLVVSEWVGLRLAVLWVGGMQAALATALAAALCALALGASLLAPLLPRGPRGVAAALFLAALGLMYSATLGWSASPETAFGRLLADGEAGARLAGGASAGGFLRALALVGPTLAPFGALLPALYRAAPAVEGGLRLGRLCLHETWGAALLLPCAHFLVVPAAGLAGAVCVSAAALLVCALALLRTAPLGALAAAGAALAGGALALRAPPAASASPPLTSPATTVLAFAEDEHFAVAVLGDGLRGERTLSTDGFRAAGTGREYRYMRALGHLPVLLHPAPQTSCVLALGTGTTAGAVLRHARVERLEVLEISRTVAAFAPWFAEVNGALLEGVDPGGGERMDGRIALVIDDGRRALARRPRRYDLITLEPLLPDSPFAVHLYTPGFYALARAALRAEGPGPALVCQWVPPHALEPETFEAVLDAFARSFAWSGAFLFGTQLVLVGADSPPLLEPSAFLCEPGSPLAAELAALALDEPAGVLTHWIGALASRTRARRALEDEDPWIVFRPRRRGAALLGDLPANLARLAELEGPPPPGWLEAAGAGALGALETGRALRGARLAFALEEARARGLALESLEPQAGREAARFEQLCAEAASSRPEDPELRELVRERSFLARLRRGVLRLASSGEREAALLALDDLVAAAELAPERADVHLYVGTALARLGEPAAARALALALERCPRIAETREGRRAREELGLAPAALEAAREAVLRAGERRP